MSGQFDACPFCGGEIVPGIDVQGWHNATCVNHCFVSAGYPTLEELMAALNTRAERTCHMDDRLAASGMYGCSECDMITTSLSSAPTYCMHCGCRVVSE